MLLNNNLRKLYKYILNPFFKKTKQHFNVSLSSNLNLCTNNTYLEMLHAAHLWSLSLMLVSLLSSVLNKLSILDL